MLADRQALIGRVDPRDLPSFPVEQAGFDEWLASEPKSVAAMTPAEIEKFEELRALGVA